MLGQNFAQAAQHDKPILSDRRFELLGGGPLHLRNGILALGFHDTYLFDESTFLVNVSVCAPKIL
ncbi:gsl1107 [Gloeobacter violaceus PCC 7421]|uniref:Gsl1107 protein n=1 Tax=Gloeobacter violaceus (strain ATCC 29082 / PCC 7421) TaxID=251221 RepID=Q7NLL6_GLOVI|nr:gsl1107 [Gloeobacter violaceus PCC 7421]